MPGFKTAKNTIFYRKCAVVFKMIEKIPKPYLSEFFKKQTLLIKKRIHLFCILAVGVYFFITITGLLAYPGDLKPAESKDKIGEGAWKG